MHTECGLHACFDRYTHLTEREINHQEQTEVIVVSNIVGVFIVAHAEEAKLRIAVSATLSGPSNFPGMAWAERKRQILRTLR